MKIEELLKYQAEYQMVPVSVSVIDDGFDSLQAMTALRESGKPSFLMTGNTQHGRDKYTFICVDPVCSLTYLDGVLTVDDFHNNPKQERVQLADYVNELMARYKAPVVDGLPPFVGGVFGYFSYDYARYATTAPINRVDNPNNLPDADLLVVDTSVAYNHKTHQITATKLVPVTTLTEQYEAVVEGLNDILQTAVDLRQGGKIQTPQISPLKLQFSEAEFANRVKTTQKHIIDGDIFQLILSNPHYANINGKLLSAAAKFFSDNQAPYQFYFEHNDFEALGASPETLVAKRGLRLFSYPLAGTRRRGRTEDEDNQLAHELQTSQKELSEHNMLIDLGRNDLGKVSQIGSVKVTSTRNLLRFNNVMHLGSVVESTIAEQTKLMDIVDAVLPAGTLSGAPKVSAMQIIAKLENNKRGIYGGGIGYLGFNDELDLAIGIRLVYRKGTKLVIHSGAGIVADSIPKYEYQEFNNKARGVINSLYAVDREGDVNEFAN
ncbi:anthranilate synthase component I family protein [Lentilactobacillus sp. Marseille-Q4993]|uniref:anthranilate synthase component I family protein n=1 Tax=Lentilactobacillus sp. Marseille-Q4993 TaxID=3039492 RepID=UPI0024BC4C49|nr:anthranilate synthase component I family protein [Lentilactobacillus sp. Marseille-Q4993]